MSLRTPVVRARWCDIDRIVDLVTGTLCPTTLGTWLVPDEHRRRSVLAAAARIWMEHALLFGDAFLLQDGSAATVWFHRYRPIPLPPGFEDRLAAVCGEHHQRFLFLCQALAARRPVEAHNHLAFLAAPPGPEGVERAAAVLAGGQRWMDTLNLPTYAEAYTPVHRELYRRHGYTDRDDFPLPGGLTAHPMWRLSPYWANPLSGNSAAHWAARPATGRARNDRMTSWALH